MPLSHEDVRKVFQILDDAEHLKYVEITIGDFTLRAGTTADSVNLAHEKAAAGSVAESESRVATTTDASNKSEASAGSGDAHEQAVDKILSQAFEIPENMAAVRSPMSGIFYITPNPEDPPFVEEGDQVAEGDSVCLVEVMKLFNSVKSPIDGRVYKMIATHGQFVKLDEVLMVIEPHGQGGTL